MDTLRDRLREHGAREDDLDALVAYLAEPIRDPGVGWDPSPLHDEPHLEHWEGYVEDARVDGALRSLSRRFAQLQFPVQEGISQNPEYRRATRKGEFLPAQDRRAPAFQRPDGIVLSLRESMAGRIPVIVASHRSDFETLVRAFAERNEPAPVPASMGACIVKGLNNWDRIHQYRRDWDAKNPKALPSEWLSEFATLRPRKRLYQDTFILLSSGPYSAVPASELSLSADVWAEDSIAIRREHELFHYFTHRRFGSMRNNLLDELLADFYGLIRVYGEYRPDYAKRFLGIYNHPQYRRGGRLENYREPEIAGECFPVLQSLCHQAIDQLHQIVSTWPGRLASLPELAELAAVLAGCRLDELADPRTVDQLMSRPVNPSKNTPA